MAKIPVGDTISYAYSFTFGNLLTLLGLTWLPLAVSAAISYYAQTLWFSWMSKFPMLMNGHPDPQLMMSMMHDMGGFAGLGFLATLVSLFMTAVVGVAVVSQALGLRSGQTFVHIAAGAPEWRVFGGYIRLFLAVIAVIIICAIGVGIAVAIGAMIHSSDGSGGGIGAIIAVILGIVLFCLAILTIVRMAYLLVPSIVAEPGKGGLARSYHLTHGNFWRIFVVTLVVVLPVLLVAAAIQGAIIGNSFMGPLTQMLKQAQNGPMTPEQMQAMFAQMIDNFRANFLPMAFIGFVTSFFLSALTLSASSFAYRALSGTAAPAAAPVTA
jgi:hypothetical protein